MGINGAPPLTDGFVPAPSSGIYNPILGGAGSGKYWRGRQNIEVAQHPVLVRNGHGPQLEKAVEVVMEELTKNPPPKLRRPAFPNHYPNGAEVRRTGRLPSHEAVSKIRSLCDL